VSRRFWLSAAATTGLVFLTAVPAAASYPEACGSSYSCVTKYYAYGYPGTPSGERVTLCGGDSYTVGYLSGYQVTVQETCAGGPV
jgi:hypothetical protein